MSGIHPPTYTAGTDVKHFDDVPMAVTKRENDFKTGLDTEPDTTTTAPRGTERRTSWSEYWGAELALPPQLRFLIQLILCFGVGAQDTFALSELGVFISNSFAIIMLINSPNPASDPIGRQTNFTPPMVAAALVGCLLGAAFSLQVGPDCTRRIRRRLVWEFVLLAVPSYCLIALLTCGILVPGTDLRGDLVFAAGLTALAQRQKAVVDGMHAWNWIIPNPAWMKWQGRFMKLFLPLWVPPPRADNPRFEAVGCAGAYFAGMGVAMFIDKRIALGLAATTNLAAAAILTCAAAAHRDEEPVSV